MFRKLLTVRGPAMNRRGESRHANLKCFAEPGDPYGKPLPYVLAHCCVGINQLSHFFGLLIAQRQ